MILPTFPDEYRAVVFGAAGGIGGAMVRALSADPRCAVVYAGARRAIEPGSTKMQAFTFDLEDEASISAAAETIPADGPVHLVVVATGLLHAPDLQPEKTWRSLDARALHRLFAVNAIGPALIGKHMLPLMSKSDKSAFAALSARVGSISDNRLGGWHAYRASKAALNMLIRNFAIELGRVNRGALCVALHPGTVDTALSGPFQDRAEASRLFTPDVAAGHLLSVIDSLTPEHSGRLFAWDGAEIVF
jgi:NAD(P)-dependent dehydrogenase (short-subunit alcohol dehydrogenase family)